MPGQKIGKKQLTLLKKTFRENSRRIKDAKSGQLNFANRQTVTAKLTLVLEAFNKCASQVHLNIDSSAISASVINITGDTSSRENTLKLFDALRAGKLDILKQQLDSKARPRRLQYFRFTQ